MAVNDGSARSASSKASRRTPSPRRSRCSDVRHAGLVTTSSAASCRIGDTYRSESASALSMRCRTGPRAITAATLIDDDMLFVNDLR